ncbi:MAG: hypothetical protein ACE15E_05105 [Acidobacteriota bacterium]
MRPIVRISRVVVVVWGAIALVPITLAFTSCPGRMHEWVATDSGGLQDKPEVIVLLGGAGIPSKSGLMRTFTTAEQAREHPEAVVVVTLRSDAGKEDSYIARMKKEQAPER